MRVNDLPRCNYFESLRSFVGKLVRFVWVATWRRALSYVSSVVVRVINQPAGDAEADCIACMYTWKTEKNCECKCYEAVISLDWADASTTTATSVRWITFEIASECILFEYGGKQNGDNTELPAQTVVRVKWWLWFFVMYVSSSTCRRFSLSFSAVFRKDCGASVVVICELDARVWASFTCGCSRRQIVESGSTSTRVESVVLQITLFSFLIIFFCVSFHFVKPTGYSVVTHLLRHVWRLTRRQSWHMWTSLECKYIMCGHHLWWWTMMLALATVPFIVATDFSNWRAF